MPNHAPPAAEVRPIASPRLTFKDSAKAIEFYQRALGAREIFRFEVEGHIPHAEIAIGDSLLMLAEEWPEGGRFSAETLGSSPVWLSIRVADVDAFAARAIAAGMAARPLLLLGADAFAKVRPKPDAWRILMAAESLLSLIGAGPNRNPALRPAISDENCYPTRPLTLKVKLPMQDQFYGHREILLGDPFGYTWNLFTVTEEMPVEEMHRRMKGISTGPEGGELKVKS